MNATDSMIATRAADMAADLGCDGLAVARATRKVETDLLVRVAAILVARSSGWCYSANVASTFGTARENAIGTICNYAHFRAINTWAVERDLAA